MDLGLWFTVNIWLEVWLLHMIVRVCMKMDASGENVRLLSSVEN